MDYAVTAELKTPGEAELDALQQEGVAAVLDRQLALIEGIAGEDEGEIDVLDYRIAVHASGASVVLALDAPSLTDAEQAAAAVLDQLLQESELLTTWTVDHSEVQITEDEFNLSLAAAEGAEDGGGALETSEGQPDEQLLAALEQALTEAEDDTELGSDEWREVLGTQADQLRAFDLTAFVAVPEDDESEQRARLAAGALVHAATFVTEALYQDELTLALQGASVADVDDLLVLTDLPPCYDFRYTTTFARALLLSTAAVATRLTAREWVPPRTVAECWGVRLMVDAARETLEAAELLSAEVAAQLFDTFLEQALPDRSFEELYEIDRSLDSAEDTGAPGERPAEEVEDELRGRGLAIDQWFVPEDTEGLHPYLLLT